MSLLKTCLSSGKILEKHLFLNTIELKIHGMLPTRLPGLVFKDVLGIIVTEPFNLVLLFSSHDKVKKG